MGYADPTHPENSALNGNFFKRAQITLRMLVIALLGSDAKIHIMAIWGAREPSCYLERVVNVTMAPDNVILVFLAVITLVSWLAVHYSENSVLGSNRLRMAGGTLDSLVIT